MICSDCATERHVAIAIAKSGTCDVCKAVKTVYSRKYGELYAVFEFIRYENGKRTTKCQITPVQSLHYGLQGWSFGHEILSNLRTWPSVNMWVAYIDPASEAMNIEDGTIEPPRYRL